MAGTTPAPVAGEVKDVEEPLIPAMKVRPPKPDKAGGLHSIVKEAQNFADEITGGNGRASGTCQFAMGLVVGIVVGMLIMYANHTVAIQRERVSHLREVSSIKAGGAGGDGAAGDLLSCKTTLRELEGTMAAISDSDDGMTLVQKLNRTEADLKQCSAKCGLCHNCEVLVNRAISKKEDDHFRDIKKLEVQLQEQERKTNDVSREKEAVDLDKQAECDEVVKRETSKILRAAENARRDLDMRLHNENIKHDASADRAIRSRDMAIKDRDTVATQKKAVEGELQQCLANLATAQKGSNRDTSKLEGELKSLGETVTECENRFADQQTNFCSMCNHCTSVHFPACTRVCH